MREPGQARTIGVMVPTYRRPGDLARCLKGLARQTQPPDDVMVVVQERDVETNRFLDSLNGNLVRWRRITVAKPGLVVARNAALDACSTDILAIVDDDAVPHPDWLARILDHFRRDPRLGGLGGKDRLHDGTGFQDGKSAVVGKLSWFGRVVPNHHLGFGPPREVDMLKGCNMSFRASAFEGIRFDTRLRGKGANANDDLAFCLAVRRAGWRLVYDPAILVDHFSGQSEEVRHYAVVAPVKDRQGYLEMAFNEVVAIWDEFPFHRKLCFAAWSFFVGTRISPGLVQAIRFTPQLGLASWHRFLLAQRGKLDAMRQLPWGGHRRSGAGSHAVPAAHGILE